jgi:hypothetical protein
VKLIPLSRGLSARVNNSDYKRFGRYKWSALKAPRTFYAVRYEGTKYIYLHRAILDFPKHGVDHKDHDGLNCTRKNLRPANSFQNARNTEKRRINATSRYKGVSFDKLKKKWYAKITVSGKQMALGYYVSEEEAAEAYKIAAVRYFGEYACTTN